MHVLVTGSKGQLGQDCLEVLGRRHQVQGLDLPELDITNRRSVETAMDAEKPEVVVNCAAFTQVDAAETERDAALRVNAEGPRLLGEAAARRGIRLIHISTDYVFDGMRPPPTPYVESDAPAPLSWYGMTKLEGERAVLASGGSHAVLRTAWLYGVNGHNFLKTILRLATSPAAKPLRVVNDQYGSPTWSYRLAIQIERVIAEGVTGLFHATAEGYCTWFELACQFLRKMDVPHTVEPCSTAEYPMLALRPRNSILENARLKAASCCVMRPWEEDLADFVGRHRAALLREVAPRYLSAM